MVWKGAYALRECFRRIPQKIVHFSYYSIFGFHVKKLNIVAVDGLSYLLPEILASVGLLTTKLKCRMHSGVNIKYAYDRQVY